VQPNSIQTRLLLPMMATMALLEVLLVSALIWMGVASGSSALLTHALPPVLAVTAGLTAIAAACYRRGLRMAQGLVESEQRATHMALHDGLTGLPNRTLLYQNLNSAVEKARRGGGAVAVLCIDLDRFKEVNDTLGHQSGDELIREAARRLSETTRASDTLARVGGDEFAVIQTSASGRSAAALAERVVTSLSGPVDLSGGRAFLGCSVGVTVLQEGGEEPAELLRQADLALYRAKDRGRGQYSFFETEMDAALKTRRAFEADLRAALAADALELVYQPQYDSAGRITAVEALARWTHADRGAVSPAYFVQLAEECGLIDAFGVFTLRRAFEDSLRWPGLKVAVNISASQLRRADFIDRVERLLEETGAKPSRLELEITEGVLLTDDPTTHDTLRRLKAMGFSLALDDFGTGYSSLSYLRRFPVDRIKIDRSFIEKLGVEREATAMVSAIVTLAQALNLAVIAEGVETTEQRRLLAEAGCLDIQGFLLSRPVSADVLDRVIRDTTVASRGEKPVGAGVC